MGTGLVDPDKHLERVMLWVLPWESRWEIPTGCEIGIEKSWKRRLKDSEIEDAGCNLGLGFRECSEGEDSILRECNGGAPYLSIEWCYSLQGTVRIRRCLCLEWLPYFSGSVNVLLCPGESGSNTWRVVIALATWLIQLFLAANDQRQPNYWHDWEP